MSTRQKLLDTAQHISRYYYPKTINDEWMSNYVRVSMGELISVYQERRNFEFQIKVTDYDQKKQYAQLSFYVQFKDDPNNTIEIATYFDRLNIVTMKRIVQKDQDPPEFTAIGYYLIPRIDKKRKM